MNARLLRPLLLGTLTCLFVGSNVMGNTMMGNVTSPPPEQNMTVGNLTSPPLGHNMTVGNVTSPPPGQNITVGNMTSPPPGQNMTMGNMTSPPPGQNMTMGNMTSPPPGQKMTMGKVTSPPPGQNMTMGNMTSPPPWQNMTVGTMTSPPSGQNMTVGSMTSPPPVHNMTMGNMTSAPPGQNMTVGNMISPPPWQNMTMGNMNSPPPWQNMTMDNVTSPPPWQNRTMGNMTTAMPGTNPPTAALALIPNTTVEVLQTPVSRSNCSTIRLCAAQPVDCDPTVSGSCFFVSTRQTMGQNFEFSLAGESDGYIAASLSMDTRPGGNDTTYVCANDGGVVRFFATLLDSGALSLTTLNVNSVRGRVNGSMIQCSFAATVPDSSSRAAASFSIGILSGSFINGTLGSPTSRLQTNVVDISNPNSTTTNTLSSNSTTLAPTTASTAPPLHRALLPALLAAAGALGRCLL